MKKLEEIMNQNNSNNKAQEDLESFITKKKNNPNVNSTHGQNTSKEKSKELSTNKKTVDNNPKKEEKSSASNEKKKSEKITTITGVEIEQNDVPPTQFKVQKKGTSQKMNVVENNKETTSASEKVEQNAKSVSNNTSVVDNNNNTQKEEIVHIEVPNETPSTDVPEDISEEFIGEVEDFTNEIRKETISKKQNVIRKKRKVRVKKPFNLVKKIRTLSVILVVVIVFFSIASLYSNSRIIDSNKDSTVSKIVNSVVDFFGIADSRKYGNESSVKNVTDFLGIVKNGATTFIGNVKNITTEGNKVEIDNKSSNDYQMTIALNQMQSDYDYSLSINKPANYRTLLQTYYNSPYDLETVSALKENKKNIIIDEIFIETEHSTAKTTTINGINYTLNGAIFGIAIEVDDKNQRREVEDLSRQIKAIIETDYNGRNLNDLLDTVSVENYIKDTIERITGSQISKVTIFTLMY